MSLSARLDKAEKIAGRSTDTTCFVDLVVQEGREAEGLEYARKQGYDPKAHWVFQRKFTTPTNDVPYIGDPFIAGVHNLRELLDDVARRGSHICERPGR